MKTTVTAATFALIFALVSAQAQSLRNSDEPQEFPPASFTGKQYIDSKGCVFIRAGFDGAVTWVPRVNRKRKVLCGFAPTFASKPAPAPAPRVAAAPTVAPPRVAPPKPPVQTMAKPPRARSAPAPVRRTVATAKPAPARRVVAAPTQRVVTAPTLRVVTAPTLRVVTAPTRRVVTAPTLRVVTAPTRRVVTPPTKRVVTSPTRRVVAVPAPGASACLDRSQLSQAYLRSGRGYAVRCGPQAVSPTGISFDGNFDQAPPNAIRVAPAPIIAPPAGYKAVWEDDRLNRNRGVQTAAGIAQSSLVWTNTVPRRLVSAPRVNPVTKAFPFLKFAFPNNRSVAAQIAYRQNLGERPVASNTVRYSTKTYTPARAVAPTQRVVAPVRQTGVQAGHRFVQVGLFGVATNAQNSAAKLQRMGLPVRVGTYQKAGKSYNIVLAGPFGSAGSLQAGLNAARRAGFSDAYTRK